MLEVKNLVKKFGSKVAVNNISFKVEKGKILGVLGRNGAGKSTIFRMILNIIKQDSGIINYMDKEITDITTDEIGYLPEEGSLILQYSVYEQCVYYGALKSMSEEEVRENLIKWLERFNITQYLNMKIKDLSKGNRQKIQFIIAILHNPNLIILDEPFSGLDPISVDELKNVIIELKKEGKIIVFSSHRMDHVEMLCEDILIIDSGKEIMYGNLNEIKKSYQKQNISITGNIDIEKIKNIDGVMEVTNISENNYNIKIENNNVVQDVLNEIDKKELLRFSVLDASLNDIFIDKVGKSYEE